MPCLAYTHLQPAQLTTVGKRATLWMNELYMDYLEVEHRLDSLALLGSKGTTGTQASFMELFGGDERKDQGSWSATLPQEMGFDRVVPVSRPDLQPQDGLLRGLPLFRGIAQTASKFSYDLRLLQNFKEMEEPFEKQPDRLLGHALQAQSHALRAYLVPEPLRDGGHPERRHHQRPPSGSSAPWMTAPTSALRSARPSSAWTPSSTSC